jgi:hypothetical protein
MSATTMELRLAPHHKRLELMRTETAELIVPVELVMRSRSPCCLQG